jgi:signal peptidase II
MRIALITVFLTLLIDQFTKLWVKSNAVLGELIYSKGIFNIHFIENEGMAFGWSWGGEWGKILLSLFRVIAIVVIAFVIRNLIENKVHKGLILSVSLVFAGALGNLLDSAFYGLFFSHSYPEVATFLPEGGGYAGFLMGHVVDMIHIEFYWPEFMPWGFGGQEVFPPIFNVADMAVSGGVITMLVFNKKFFGEGKGDFSIFKRNKNKNSENEEASKSEIKDTVHEVSN